MIDRMLSMQLKELVSLHCEIKDGDKPGERDHQWNTQQSGRFQHLSFQVVCCLIVLIKKFSGKFLVNAPESSTHGSSASLQSSVFWGLMTLALYTWIWEYSLKICQVDEAVLETCSALSRWYWAHKEQCLVFCRYDA